VVVVSQIPESKVLRLEEEEKEEKARKRCNTVILLAVATRHCI
jgi:hypothetical protein